MISPLDGLGSLPGKGLSTSRHKSSAPESSRMEHSRSLLKHLIIHEQRTGVISLLPSTIIHRDSMLWTCYRIIALFHHRHPPSYHETRTRSREITRIQEWDRMLSYSMQVPLKSLMTESDTPSTTVGDWCWSTTSS